MEIRCVVCSQVLVPERATFANAWEASLGQRPCCGDACAARFDADVHWMPVREPPPTDETSQQRLLAGATERLRGGDHARVVARDLLLAGVPPETVRRSIGAVDAASTAQRELAVGASMLSGFRALWSPRGGSHTVRASDAFDEIDAWIRRFPARR